MFPRLGCVAFLCRAGGPSLVLPVCPVWCPGSSPTLAVVRPCLSRSALPSVVGGCWGVAVGAVFCPPFLFVVGIGGVASRSSQCGSVASSGGGVLWVWLSVLSYSGPPSRAMVPLVNATPSPAFFLLCFPAGAPCCVRIPVVGGLPLHWRGSVSACPGWCFSWSVGGRAPVVVRLLWRRPVSGQGRVVSRCPSGGSVGVTGSLALLPVRPPWWSGCVAWQFCGCPSFLPPPPLVGGCALVGGRGLLFWLIPAVSC